VVRRDELESAGVGIWVHPFTAKVGVDEEGTYTLGVDPREMQIEMAKLVVFLSDFLVRSFLGFDDLDEALRNLRDCASINRFYEAAWPFGSAPPDVTQGCEYSKPTAAAVMFGVTDQIGGGWFAER